MLSNKQKLTISATYQIICWVYAHSSFLLLFFLLLLWYHYTQTLILDGPKKLKHGCCWFAHFLANNTDSAKVLLREKKTVGELKEKRNGWTVNKKW